MRRLTFREKKAAIVLLVLAYALAYTLAAAFYLAGGDPASVPGFLMATVYMLTPLAAVLLVQRFVLQERLLRGIGVSWRLNRWFLVAILAPLVLVLLTIVVSTFFSGVSYSPTGEGFQRFQPPGEVPMEQPPFHPLVFGVIVGVVAGVTVNALFAFGEEAGWRGLLQRLVGPMGFWRSSLLTGVAWGFWHAPLVIQGHNYPEHPQLGVFMMVAWTILLSPLFSYVRLRSGSVIAAAVLHGVLNGTAGLSVLMVVGGDDLTVGVTGLAGFIALTLLLLALFVHDRFLAKERIDEVIRMMDPASIDPAVDAKG
jgi:uncharacterized protein